MKIGMVTGKDFCSLRDVSFNLADQGLVALQGANLDDTSATSNGSGKSGLMDLVSWVASGSTARGSSGDAIIRRGEKEAQGSLFIHDDDLSLWLITRSRKKGKESLKLTHEIGGHLPVSHTLGTIKLTQDLIWKLLGCTEEVFRAAVYVGQESLPDLPLMTDKNLKYLIEKAAGIEVLDRAYQIAREHSTIEGGVVSTLTNTLTRATDQLAHNEGNLAQVEVDQINWSSDRDIKVAALNTRYETACELEHDLDQKLLKAPDVAKLTAGIHMIEAKLAAFKAQTDEEKRLARVAADKGIQAIDAQGAAHRRSTDVLRMQAELDGLTDTIGTPCSKCSSPITASHIDPMRHNCESLLHVARDEVATLLDIKHAAHKAHTEAQGALDAFRATMLDPTTLSDQRARLGTALGERNRLMDAYQAACTCKRDLDREINALMLAVNPLDAQVARLQVAIVENKALIVATTTKLQEAQALFDDHQVAVQVYGPAGVRAHMLDEVTPFLNAQTAQYLTVLADGNITAGWSTLTRNAKGEYKEQFAIDVTKLDGGSFCDLSGGEKRKVRIACALALQDLVASRATKSLGLFVCDEIDTALDPAGLERLMIVLHEKAKERGTTVVISHTNLSDWISNVWKVTKKDGASTLTI